MEVELICSRNLRKVMEEILGNRGVIVCEESKLQLVEKGYDSSNGKIGIYFELETIDILMDLFDTLSKNVSSKSNIVMGKINDSYRVIDLEKIIYFEGVGNEVYCLTYDNRYFVKERLYEIEDNLKAKGFIRISKSIVINIMEVEEIVPWFNGKLRLKVSKSDEEIYVSRAYAKDFKKYLGI